MYIHIWDRLLLQVPFTCTGVFLARLFYRSLFIYTGVSLDICFCRYTALHFAAGHGNKEMIEVLLVNSSEVNTQSSDLKLSPILFASSAGVLQCVAVCCSVLQCVAVCCSILLVNSSEVNSQWSNLNMSPILSASSACVLQCVAACCSVLQCVAVCCSVLQCVVVGTRRRRLRSRIRLWCVAVCYISCRSVLQHSCAALVDTGCWGVLQLTSAMKFLRMDPGMGWLRLVGSIKLQVSFAEYSLFYRAFLQKRPII